MSMVAMLACPGAKAQEFPGFLEGTWKTAEGNSFEHWDRVDANAMKGFGFRMEKGLPVVSEYLEISRKENQVIYIATVLDQNQGEGIPFVLVYKDSTYSFENNGHDFPRIIRYKPVTRNRIYVYVGTEEEGFEQVMVRAEAE